MPNSVFLEPLPGVPTAAMIFSPEVLLLSDLEGFEQGSLDAGYEGDKLDRPQKDMYTIATGEELRGIHTRDCSLD